MMSVMSVARYGIMPTLVSIINEGVHATTIRSVFLMHMT